MEGQASHAHYAHHFGGQHARKKVGSFLYCSKSNDRQRVGAGGYEPEIPAGRA